MDDPNTLGVAAIVLHRMRVLVQPGHLWSHEQLDRLFMHGPACPKGHYCPPGSAEPTECPLNTYMPDQGASVCTSCPAFSTSTGTGATSIAACQCTKGFYANVDPTSELTMCTACPEGATTKADAGASSVNECVCQAGRFLSIEGDSATCPQCAALQYRHACMHRCIMHACIHTCTHPCIHACILVSQSARGLRCAALIDTHMHACLHTGARMHSRGPQRSSLAPPRSKLANASRATTWRPTQQAALVWHATHC